MKAMRHFSIFLGTLAAAAALGGCGGSGGGSDGPAATTTVDGSVVAGPVAGANVAVKDASGTTVAGPVLTASDGTYSIAVPDAALGGILFFESSGGTFTDEAAGSAGVTAGGLMAAVEAGALGDGSAVHLTPATTIAGALVGHHGKTPAEAADLVEAAFGFAPDAAIAPLNAPAAEASEDSRLAALRAGAFSHLAAGLGLTPAQQFDLFHELGQDLSDGALDGAVDGGPLSVGTVTLPEDVQGRFAGALRDFYLDTSRNRTGLTAEKVGALPFAKVALTDTYRVEYLPGSEPAAMGRTEFQIRVTRRDDSTPASGLALTLMPKMHMPDRAHATPQDLPIVDNGDGTYSCALYYLMATRANGMAMGFWELKVGLGGMGSESVTFYPEVAMPMGDTVRAVLRGQADNEVSMMVPPNRRYFVFNDGVTGTPGSHTIHLFLAAFDSMMSWPALEVGTVLHPPAPQDPWTVGAVEVEASTDGTTWVGGTSDGAHWSVPNLTGLANGAAGRVFVRLTVNGEQKTTDGKAPSGSNGYADFTVTPGL